MATRGSPSKTELAYGQRLEMLRMAGELLSVEHQPEAIELPADRCTFTADWRTVEPGGAVTFWEVKGAKKAARGKTAPHYFDGEARLKAKLAARALSLMTPPARLVVVWPGPHGGWESKQVKP